MKTFLISRKRRRTAYASSVDVQINGDLDVDGTATIDGPLTVTDATQTTNVSTGSIITAGGIGAAKNVSVGGRLMVTDTTQATVPLSGSLFTYGGLGVDKDAFIGGNLTVTGSVTPGSLILSAITPTTVTASGAISTTDATQSTSTATGSVVTAGGIGAAKNIRAGGIIAVDAATDSTSSTTGSIITNGGLGVAKAGHFGGQLAADATTETSSATTGSLVTSGGLGVAKKVYVGSSTEAASTSTGSIITAGGIGCAKTVYANQVLVTTDIVGGASITGVTVQGTTLVSATGTTESSSTSTGALQTLGGAGIAKNVYVGGNVSIAGATGLLACANVLNRQLPSYASGSDTITIGATVTNPTKPTSVLYDTVTWQVMGGWMMAHYHYQNNASAAGSNAGNGRYLFTLPGGYAMPSSIPVYAGTDRTFCHAIGSGLVGFTANNGWPCTPYAYSTTQFGVLLDNATFLSNTYDSLADSNVMYSFVISVPVTATATSRFSTFAIS
jgi:hypothetical protein